MTTQYYTAADTQGFAPELFTLNDLLVEMADFSSARISEVMNRNWRRAIHDAMVALASNRACEWRYYNTQARLPISEEVELTGYYDHTGGSSELLFTVTDGTIPDWVEFAHAEYDGTYYEVGRKLSSSTIAFSVRANPGADVASVGSPVVFTFYRTTYPLPADFIKLISLFSGSTKTDFTYVSADEADYLEKIVRASGRPYYYTTCGSQKFPGTQLLVISPKASTTEVIDITYRRYARALTATGFADGEYDTDGFTATAGQLTATLASTLPQRYVGSVIRVRTDANTPQGKFDQYPYAEQRIITNISSTTITVDRAWEASYSTKAMIVSDPIDVAPHMLNALKAEAKRRVARSQPREYKELQPLDMDAHRELEAAMEADRNYHSEPSTRIWVDRIHL